MKNMRSNQWEEIEKPKRRGDNKPKRPIGSDYRKMRDDFDED